MQHQHLSGDEDRLGKLFRLCVLLQDSDHAHGQVQVAFEWTNHRVVNGFIQSLQESIRLFFLFKAPVSGDICEADDLALLIVKDERQARDN